MGNLEHLALIRNADKSKDFRDFVKRGRDRYGDKTAFTIKKKQRKNIEYRKISYRDLYNQVNALACSFVEKGFHTQRIAIIGENCYEWMLSYLAALSCGAVAVPLDKGLAYSEIRMSIQRSKAAIIIFDQKYQKLIAQLESEGIFEPDQCICMNAALEGKSSVEQLAAEGEEIWKNNSGLIDQLDIDPDALAIILFTSGTTSMAKAVMLSQNNLLSNIYDMEMVEEILSTDVNMAFLPYHHTFGGTGQLVMLNCGTETAFCDGLKYVQKNLVEYKISVFFSVPLLIESIYKRIMKTAEKTGQLKKLRFGKKLSSFLMFFGIDRRRKIFKTVLDQLGGDLRLVISGGASIEPETLEGFRMLGIETINGYGMTESSPVIASENRDTKKPGSIGKAMPSVSVRIDAPNEEGVGEIVAKGPNIMLGYYENEEATAEALEDGWLHTGDLGFIDEDGCLFVCGRKKSVIVLRNGKNVFPEEIELLASELPYTLESFVFALPKKGNPKDSTLYIKIVYDPAYFEESHIEKEDIQKTIEQDMEEINKTMPKYKQVHQCIVTTEPMIKTTSGKVKRHEELEVIKKALEE